MVDTYAILSQEQRDTPQQIRVWKKFLLLLNENFKVENIPKNKQHPVYSSADIDLMIVSRKPITGD